jgi:uncharacterized protein YbcI
VSLTPTNPLLEIANATVHLYKQTYGRGPTYARARFAGNDTLVVLLHDTMTVNERQLAALGQHDRLREQRALLRGGLEEEMRAVIERILVRRTVAAVNGIDTYRDIAAEVFVLAPVPGLDPQG